MKIAYTIAEKTGNIVLPEGAPFDGKEYLIKVATGWVQARWIAAEGTGESTEGFEWCALDDQLTFDLDDATAWEFLPHYDKVDVSPEETIFRNAMVQPHTETLKDSELLGLLYDADMLPEQCVTAQGAVHLAALCIVWQRAKVAEALAAGLTVERDELQKGLQLYKDYGTTDPFLAGPR